MPVSILSECTIKYDFEKFLDVIIFIYISSSLLVLCCFCIKCADLFLVFFDKRLVIQKYLFLFCECLHGNIYFIKLDYTFGW